MRPAPGGLISWGVDATDMGVRVGIGWATVPVGVGVALDANIAVGVNTDVRVATGVSSSRVLVEAGVIANGIWIGVNVTVGIGIGVGDNGIQPLA